MKQRDIIRAYNAIHAISTREKNKKNASLKLNYALFKIRKMLDPQYEFQTERQKALMDEMNPELTDKDTLRFKSVEQKEEFTRRLDEIGEMEISLPEFEKQKVSLSEDVSINVDEIAALEPFIEFTD